MDDFERNVIDRFALMGERVTRLATQFEHFDDKVETITNTCKNLSSNDTTLAQRVNDLELTRAKWLGAGVGLSVLTTILTVVILSRTVFFGGGV